jgi:hypothetical protein
MDQELVQYLEGRFQSIDELFRQQEQRFNARFDRQEQWLLEKMDVRFEDVKRYTGILAEEFRREVQLVAEGFAVFVEGRYTQDQATIQQQFRETHALIRSSYEHLQQQQDQTRQRIENIERKSPN